MECDITIKFQRIAAAALVCVCFSLCQPNRDGEMFADTLRIRKPVTVNNGQRNQQQIETREGEVLIEAQDGSLLFQEMDGRLRVLTRDEVAGKTIQDVPLEPMTKQQVADALLAELPEGFRIHTTADYVIAYQTERAYAKWIGNLYQGRLKRNFRKFWGKRKFKLKVEEPRFPLVAIIFATREEFAACVQRELGIKTGSMVAYYNLLTNRVTMYDLTAQQRPGSGEVLERDIKRILEDANCIPMVTTIVHEGTHQLMFNSGLQTRLADLPLWLNEGVAMFFETPDLNATQGWNGPGRTNYSRLRDLKRYARAPDALELLVANDGRFKKEGDAMLSAYAESWALTHFLINRKPIEFGRYLNFLSQKQVQQPPAAEQRLLEFKKFFGDDLSKLDEEFIQYVTRLK